MIADTHFGHANIIRHSERPFRTLGEMNSALIANWNETVRDGDTVYHLDDFSDPPMNRHIEAIAERLRGQIVLIAGNHDVDPVNQVRPVAADRTAVTLVAPGDPPLLLTHVPLLLTHGSVNVHGHASSVARHAASRRNRPCRSGASIPPGGA